MELAIRYQAVPGRSRFFARLRQDGAFPPLVTALFPHGAGVFDFLASRPAAAAKALEEAAARLPGTFGKAAPARRRVADFVAEAERARRRYPGIEARVATLEEFFQVEWGLEGAVKRDPRRGDGWGPKLVLGDRVLTPRGIRPASYYGLSDPGLRFVRRSLVRKGAWLLRPLPPSAVYFWGPDPPQRYREEYRRWRRFFLAAEERGDVLLLHVLVPGDAEGAAPPPPAPPRQTRPCPYCGAALRTDQARQCFTCGTDWHDPANVVCLA